MTTIIGIDFGTTNSVLSVLEPDGSTRNARFTDAQLETFRSVLCFWTEEEHHRTQLRSAAGPRAIAAYLDDPLDSRLIMSMKSYLAQRSFTQTTLYNRTVTLEQLIGIFLRAFLAEAGIETQGAHVVAGRPVKFVGETADDALGEQRLRDAFAAAGVGAIDTAFEPEAAGYRFARDLTAPANVLIGDFGGGTSDFSIVRFDGGQVTPLGTTGIGIAGDVFDFRIIDNVISPRLGKGDTYRITKTDLPVPPEYFSAFARWHRLSLMKAPKTLRAIAEVAKAAKHPERLLGLITLIEDEMGYQLYQAVSAAKAALSRAEQVTLRFHHKTIRIDEVITRAAFEGWIGEDIALMDQTVGRALAEARLDAGAIDHVFLTGGTSFVPAVRRLFELRFGAERVSAGGEFVSVAEGLALIGRDRLAGAAKSG
jgi:hypothetical chaperone protein